MAAITLRRIIKRFGGADPVVRDVDLTIAEGEFFVLLGPSGCGKSTLLRMLAGLDDPSAGEIWFDDDLMNYVPPGQRNVALVFQNYALYPHMTVGRNIAFPLKMAGERWKSALQEAQDTAESLGLGSLFDRKVATLSGGQRQRVALGRAVIREPRVMLMDEPLSNLDALLRVHMREELLRLHRQIRTTVVYVTHDQVEAMTMADRIGIMSDGRIEQVGSPLEVYNEPNSTFVASFLGSPPMTLLPGKLRGGENGTVFVGDGVEIPLPPVLASEQIPDGRVILGIRPEGAVVGDRQASTRWEVELVESLGAETILALRSGPTRIRARIPGVPQVAVGATVGVTFSPSALFLFDEAGQRALRPAPSSAVESNPDAPFSRSHWRHDEMSLQQSLREYDPFSVDVLEDPYPTYAWLRQNHPVYRNEEIGFVALSRFEDVQAAARDWRTFSSASGIVLDGTGQAVAPGNFLELDPPEHDRLRALVQGHYTPRASAQLESAAADIAERLLAKLVADGGGDLARDFALRIPVQVASRVLGLPAEANDELETLLRRAFTRVVGEPTMPEHAMSAAFAIREYIEHHVKQVRLGRTPAHGVIEQLVEGERADRLQRAETVSTVLLLLVAGTEGPSHLLGNATLLIAEYDGLRTALQDRPEVLPAAVEEIVRFESPSQSLMRTCTTDTTIRGVQIERGERVLLLFASANRDPSRFSDPDVLNIDRPQLRHLGFGVGVHFCVGAPLARVLARASIKTLVTRAPEYRLAGPVARKAKYDIRGVDALPVTFR